MGTLLKINNLSKDFSGLEVLSGISLEVDEGERHAIIGPNGAGKSTLFNLITGLYKPTRGKISFFKKDITDWSIDRIARLGISRSFQIINIFPLMTVYENVRNAIVSKFNRRFNWTSFLGRDRRIREETDRVIDLLALGSVRDTVASELSYGRQRHLELALTIARDPALVLLDEPTAGLNTEETKNVVQLIRQVTEGRALLIVEHDMDVVFSLADRITVLNAGTLLATGTLSEIRENEEVKRVYLGRK